MRLNKYIGGSGFCSRREADKLIDAGRVKINGLLAEKGTLIKTGDKVYIDDELISSNISKIYIAYNKPRGITSTTDERDSTNMISHINHNERIFPIGRLDKYSEGLILLTNDGDIVNKILRSTNNHEKEYLVRVDKEITKEFLQKMKKGVHILNTVTRPCKISKINSHVFKIILKQGLNRQIRRMCETLNYKVFKLKRIRIMNITLGDLPKGDWRNLTQEEIKRLQLSLLDSQNSPEYKGNIKNG